ncbi:recQ-mediated genome instability protein 2-like [Magallana gigas]|uniref:recQ-mediated genome instability protein 2-like n=1 Tax=Magallana gigas TaxID=29159 RepID=UPI0033412FB7
MMASILDYPARKVFVKDLTKCVRLQTQGVENVGKKKQKEWKIECNGVEFIATVVWMQGLVTEINKEEGFMILDDSTGRVKVAGYNNIPFISLSLATGQYVMVIASVSRCGDLPVVCALKLQSLTQVENAERSWSLEVMDQILHLSALG